MIRTNQILENIPQITIIEDKSVMFVEKFRRPRKLHRAVFDAQDSSHGTDRDIGGTHQGRSAAGSDGIEEVENFFILHLCRHGDLRGIEIRKTFAKPARAGDHSRDPEADVVRPFVADDLERQARHRRAFNGRRAIRIEDPAREGCQKPSRRRPESDTNNIRFHAGALRFGIFHVGHWG